jgi:excisionase family DNA binding protein
LSRSTVTPPGSAPTPVEAGRGLTVTDVARRYRVSEDKVRTWIARGELRAINTAAALCGRPRWVIPPEALEAFEQRRAGGPPPKPERKRRKRQPDFVDYYPD